MIVLSLSARLRVESLISRKCGCPIVAAFLALGLSGWVCDPPAVAAQDAAAARAVAAGLDPNPATPTPRVPTLEEVLISHGVGTSPEALVGFLEQGFSEKALARELPREPVPKMQLVISAMQKLGEDRHKPAVDVLIKLTAGETTPGIQQILRIDLQGTDATFSDSERARLLKAVSFNAMVALGWIGDERAIPAIKAAIETGARRDSGYLTQGAVALASLGDVSGLPPVIRLLKEGNPGEQTGAARIFYEITGRYYPLTPNTAIAKRKSILKDLANWEKTELAKFQVTRAEVLRRRLAAYPPPQPPRGGVRDKIRIANNVVGDYTESFKAREELAQLPKERWSELEAVCRDEMEDLDVRREAVRSYVQLARRDSLPLLEDLEDDENEVFAEYVKASRERVKEFVKQGRE